jgi:hypothetical protein
VKKVIKKVLRRLGLLGLYEYSQLPIGSTVLIHIGKCGGRTVKNGIQNAEKNLVNYSVHIKKPVYRKDLKYVVMARGPISRLTSAFRWRYKLVVSDGVQKDRFEGEYEVLTKYKNLNNIAEALYDESGIANITAQQEMRKIHHIREDISFYLSDLLRKCHPDQILAVLMQENLDEDIFRVFGYRNELYEHCNPSAEDDQGLTESGLRNLKRFFVEDYEALTKLYCWGKIDREVIVKAL